MAVILEPCEESRRISAAICSWDCLLLTEPSTRIGFDPLCENPQGFGPGHTPSRFGCERHKKKNTLPAACGSKVGVRNQHGSVRCVRDGESILADTLGIWSLIELKALGTSCNRHEMRWVTSQRLEGLQNLSCGLARCDSCNAQAPSTRACASDAAPPL